MTMSAQQLVSKSDYARRVDRSPAAVTHWIKEGKLTKPALVDVDGEEMIDALAADAMLALTLHPSQQAAQDRPIGVPADLADDAGDVADIGDEDNRRFLKARADRMALEAEGLHRKRLAETGQWMVTADARQAWAREMSAAINETEAWLTQVAETLAGELHLDRKLILVTLRREFRAFRQRQAESKRGAEQVAAE